MALTPCVIAVVPHERLTRLTEESPHLTRLYWFSTNLDAAVHREWEVSLGRRSAHARIAHLFCEMKARLDLVGLADAHGFAFPLTQIDLAECVGLTSVHVNRVLKDLREEGLAQFRSGRVSISDVPRLRRLAEFDDAYLYLDRLPL
jgi:CRP-like cAMP-binding protein